MCNIQQLPIFIMATRLYIFGNSLQNTLKFVVNELTRFYPLSAEMAAFLHPHTHQKKSGLCRCK